MSAEEVWRGDERLISRPDTNDHKDSQLLTETHLEQTRANSEFRAIADFLANATYLHLVPQLLKFGDRIGGNRLEDDPFGQGFLERLAKCDKRVRDSRLKKIGKALSAAVPQFEELRYQPDEMGHPHLEALYKHHRPKADWQREEHFSDGTLRLLGILWSLLDGNGLLLIEEPELSLHQVVVEQIPVLIDRIQRSAKHRRQIVISPHSDALLENKGIDVRDVIVLVPDQEGTRVRSVSAAEEIRSGSRSVRGGGDTAANAPRGSRAAWIFLGMTEIYLATEDALSEAVAERLVMDSNKKLRIAVRLGRQGNGYLKKKFPELIRVANSFPVLMLTDLDRIECPPALIAEWGSGPPAMLFRIAVREVEAWLLADREACAAFVGAPVNKLPLNPDSLDDPKQTLLGFVRRYGRREIKADILPKPGSRSKIGLGYNQRLRRFVAELWEPERATACSDSLARAFARLRNV